MCDTCGCGTPRVRTVDIKARLLASNSTAAAHNRAHFFERQIFAINLMGAPGAGKTALLEATIGRWKSTQRIAVIEGDQATTRDSVRIQNAGGVALQVETGLGCHLDGAQIHRALHGIELARDDLLFIENVGNLVCPALFDLGEQLRVVVTSPTEGVDKPLKYPPMFRAVDIVVLNKCDLLRHVPFQLEEWRAYVLATNPTAEIIKTSAVTGDGIDGWLGLIEQRRAAFMVRKAR
jgi:hydrogenase nickel incorporation protein HypB